MYRQKTIGERLEALRTDRDLTYKALSAETGISSSSLSNYEKDEYKDISPFAVVKLARFYGVSTDYMLGLTENLNHPNTELSELHLTDEAIDIIKNSQVNPRLLSEMIAHPNFERFLVDAEIYVDQVASMHICQMNMYVNLCRDKLIGHCHPDANDLFKRTLDSAIVNEDEYFSRMVADDLNPILRDIRTAHEKDPGSGTDDVFMNFKKSVEEAISMKGTALEKEAVILLRQMGIDYSKLSTEELVMLINLLKKSEWGKSPVSQRGRFPGQLHGKGKRKR